MRKAAVGLSQSPQFIPEPSTTSNSNSNQFYFTWPDEGSSARRRWQEGQGGDRSEVHGRPPQPLEILLTVIALP